MNHDSPRQSWNRWEFSTPLGARTGGRLVWASAIDGLVLNSTASPSLLYLARFPGQAPRIWAEQDWITVEATHSISSGSPARDSLPPPEVRLNGAIPWEIEFHNGVSHLTADLAQLSLRSLDILGGADQIRMKLSQPQGTVYIYISGGVRQGIFSLPPQTGIRLRVSGGCTDVRFEDQQIVALDTDASLENASIECPSDWYEICIAGGASRLAIEREG